MQSPKPSRDLICGCAPCGCTCADHSYNHQPQACAGHVMRAISEEAVRLVVVSLFVGVIAIWAAILSA